MYDNFYPILKEYLAKLSQPLYFAGTVVSIRRQQVELTIIPFNSTGTGPGCIDEIAISLPRVSRFL